MEAPSEPALLESCAEPAGVEAEAEALVPVGLVETFAVLEAAGVETLACVLALGPEEPLWPDELVLVEAAGADTLVEEETEAEGALGALGCEGGAGGGGACALVETLAEALEPDVEAEAETLTLADGVETVALVVVETEGADGVETPGSPSAWAGTA